MPDQSTDQRFRLDPDALRRYHAIAAEVATQLTTAAQTASGAIGLDQVRTDLGLVGEEFAARLETVIGEHVQTLTTAAAVVSAHGEALRQHATTATATDQDAAAGLARAEETLA